MVLSWHAPNRKGRENNMEKLIGEGKNRAIISNYHHRQNLGKTNVIYCQLNWVPWWKTTMTITIFPTTYLFFPSSTLFLHSQLLLLSPPSGSDGMAGQSIIASLFYFLLTLFPIVGLLHGFLQVAPVWGPPWAAV